MAKSTKGVSTGDKIFVIDDHTFDISGAEVADDSDGGIVWVNYDNRSGKAAYGEHRWAATKAEAKTKALKLATNKREELTVRLTEINSAITKLGGK